MERSSDDAKEAAVENSEAARAEGVSSSATEAAPAEAVKTVGLRQRESVGEVLEQIDPQLLTALPPELGSLLKKQVEISIQQVSRTTRSSPLPPPEEIEEYGRIIPNGAERLMVVFEKQSNHRMDLERSVVMSQQNQSSLGQIFAFILGMTGLVVACILGVTGHDWAAVGIGGTSLVALVTTFIAGKKQQTKSLDEKRPNVQSPPRN